MEDERLAVSLVSELAEERVPCRETRTGLEKSASGITGAVRVRPGIVLGVGRLVEPSLVRRLI